MIKVLFVCTANICRSPMAAAMFRHLCAQRGMTEIGIASAGTEAVPNVPHSPLVAEALAAEGIEPLNALSKPLTLEHLRQADLIIGMTRRHVQFVAQMDASAAERTRTLFSFVGSSRDVVDPFMGSIKTYKACLQTISPLIERLADYVSAMAVKGT